MNIKEFGETLRERLEGKIEGVHRIELRPFDKNNSVTLQALVFRDERSNISPVIYLENFYQRYKEGEELDVIAEKVRDFYEQSRVECTFDVDFILDWEQVKSQVAFKLINKKRNEKLLCELPHKEVLDLAMVFYITLYNGEASILIRNNMLEKWNVEVEDLESVAIENTPQLLPAYFHSMDEVFEELTGESTGVAGKLYVLSNESKKFGAGAILYPDMIKKIGEHLQSDFYVIPCSVHETLIWPRDRETEADIESFTNIIHTVNESSLAPEEVLGDGVYVCSKGGGISCYGSDV